MASILKINIILGFCILSLPGCALVTALTNPCSGLTSPTSKFTIKCSPIIDNQSIRGSISGKIMDKITGKPLENVRVTSHFISTFTDKNGEFYTPFSSSSTIESAGTTEINGRRYEYNKNINETEIYKEGYKVLNLPEISAQQASVANDLYVFVSNMEFSLEPLTEKVTTNE